jgi:integrase
MITEGSPVSIRSRQLSNGKTAYDVELRRPDGSKYGKTFHTKRHAQLWEAKERADRSRDRWVDPAAGRVPLGDYTVEWLANRKLAPRTREIYKSQLGHVLPEFGHVPLNAITRRAVRTWFARLRREVSPLQAAKCYRLLMAILNTAADDDLIGKNRCKLKGAAREDTLERPLMSLEQALALADAIEPRYRALVLLAAGCGLRLGELLALTRADLDLLHRRVSVTKQRQELSTGIEVRAPKTAAGKRTVAIPKILVAELEAHLHAFVGQSPDAPCFTGPRGGVRRATVYKAWHEALREVGLRPDLKPHDLRHLSNTLAARVPGTSVKDLMTRMGHSSSQAALRYLHATDDADRGMADGIDAAIKAATAPPQSEDAAAADAG